MTRFKEKRRIDAAISHKDKPELEWALSYAKSRLSIAKLKSHQKHWKKIISEVERILEEIA